MKQFDVVAMGELLIDFTENGISSQGNPLLEANPGGAPCNVLAMLAKLGKSVAFIGKVGNDQFGSQLKDTLRAVGIDMRGLVTDPVVHTTLAFVHTLPDGDRDFSFYRDPGADMMLTAQELAPGLVEQAKIFHFGTLSMTHDAVRAATLCALDRARQAGVKVSFDPNLRPPLWSSMELAKECMELGMSRCDYLKIADNEVRFFTGAEDYEEGVRLIRKQYPNISVLFLTMGANGSRAYCRDLRAEQPGFMVDTVDTCGAGDTFCGCALGYLLDHDPAKLTQDQLNELLRFANAAAALVTTKKGAIRSMPERWQVNALCNASVGQ